MSDNISVFKLASTDIFELLKGREYYKINESNHQIYVNLINNNLSNLDDTSKTIIESDQYLINLAEDLFPIYGMCIILRILIQTVVDLENKDVLFCMISNTDNKTLIQFIESFLITQSIMNNLIEYYSKININSDVLSILERVSKENGFNEIVLDVENNINNKILVLAISVDILDLLSLSGTCKTTRNYILSNLNIFICRYNLDIYHYISVSELVKSYISKNVINEMIFYINVKNYHKFFGIFTINRRTISHSNYKELLYFLVINCNDINIILNTINHKLIKYVVDLCCDLNRLDILLEINKKYNEDIKKYLIELMDNGRYDIVHGLFTIDRQLICHVQSQIAKLAKRRDKYTLLLLFCPTEGELNTHNINTFVQSIIDNLWRGVNNGVTINRLHKK